MAAAPSFQRPLTQYELALPKAADHRANVWPCAAPGCTAIGHWGFGRTKSSEGVRYCRAHVKPDGAGSWLPDPGAGARA